MLWLNRLLIVAVVVGSLSGVFARVGGQVGGKPTAAENTAPAETRADELRQLQADAARMRALLNQMRANLGFVGGTTSPVYHEFDLDAQMWQTLLDQMDRRIAELQRQNSGSK